MTTTVLQCQRLDMPECPKAVLKGYIGPILLFFLAVTHRFLSSYSTFLVIKACEDNDRWVLEFCWWSDHIKFDIVTLQGVSGHKKLKKPSLLLLCCSVKTRKIAVSQNGTSPLLGSHCVQPVILIRVTAVATAASKMVVIMLTKHLVVSFYSRIIYRNRLFYYFCLMLKHTLS